MIGSEKLRSVLQGYIAARPVPTVEQATRKAEKTKRRILDAAVAETIREGIAGLSMRKIAAEVDLSLGNLTYHFPSKASLIEAMVDERIADYALLFQNVLERSGPTPQDQLASIVRLLVEDLRNPEIGFFPQLWAHAMVDETTWRQMHKLYDVEREIFVAFITAAAPSLPLLEAEEMALDLQATIEGLTIFIGMGRRKDGIFSDPATPLLKRLNDKLTFANK